MHGLLEEVVKSVPFCNHENTNIQRKYGKEWLLKCCPLLQHAMCFGTTTNKMVSDVVCFNIWTSISKFFKYSFLSWRTWHISSATWICHVLILFVPPLLLNLLFKIDESSVSFQDGFPFVARNLLKILKVTLHHNHIVS